MKQDVVNTSSLFKISAVEATKTSWGGRPVGSYQLPAFSSVSSQTHMPFPLSKERVCAAQHNHIILESWNSLVWKGPSKVMLSNTPATSRDNAMKR